MAVTNDATKSLLYMQREARKAEIEAAEKRKEIERLRHEAEAKERAERLRPDREKLAAFADQLHMCLDECYPEIDDMQLINQLVLGCDHIKRGIKILREAE